MLREPRNDQPPARALLGVLPACMGGWCAERGHCWRHLTPHRRFVVERLCRYGEECPEPVFVVQFVERELDAQEVA